MKRGWPHPCQGPIGRARGARATCGRSNDRPIFRARGRVGARDEKRGGEASSAAAILDRARQLPRSHRQTPRPPLSPDPVVRTTPGPLPPTPLPLRAAIAIAPGPGAREKGGGRSPPPPIAIRSSAAAPAPVVRASGSTGPDPFPSSPRRRRPPSLPPQPLRHRRPSRHGRPRPWWAPPAPGAALALGRAAPVSAVLAVRGPLLRPLPLPPPRPSASPWGRPATPSPRGIRVGPRGVRGTAPSASALAPRRVDAGAPKLRCPPSRSSPFCGGRPLGGAAAFTWARGCEPPGQGPQCGAESSLPGPSLPSVGATAPKMG